MNNYKKYNMTNISFEDIDALIDDYINQVKNDYIKKVDIKIKENDLSINIEPYKIESKKWNKLIELLKNKKVNFWFRDDDIGKFDDSLEELLDYFKNKNIDILLAVIPTEVDDVTAVKIKKYNNVLLGQHGYSHTNYSKTEKAEFTTERNVEEVKTQIKNGREKLKKLFEEKYIDIFIPPWFEIDENTLKTVQELDYKAISNYWDNQINKNNTIEANTQVDFVNWDKAKTFGGTDYVLDQIINELNKEKNEYYIGLLLHHERVGNQTYNFLDELIDVISKYAKFTNINNLINYIGDLND